MSAGTGSDAKGRGAAARRAAVLPPDPVPQVRLRWLLGALAMLILAALACAYISLCLLFVQGQWQLLYQPSRVVQATPNTTGLAYSQIAFAVDEAGTAQLTGWWIPGGAGAKTILYLHGSSGSLADTLPTLLRLHGLGANVFAIDYRGYGLSAGKRPGEATMVEDMRAALRYLEQTRRLPPDSIVVWGAGVGATVAVEAAPGYRLVLEQMSEPAYAQLRRDPRTRLLPLSLLLRDKLNPGPELQTSRSAKLFLVPSDGSRGRMPDPTQHWFALAAQPKTLQLGTADNAVETFLKQP